MLAIGFIVAGAIQLFAQRITIGPEIGMNWSRFNVDAPGIDEDGFRARAGLKAGGIVDIGINRMISVQPGIFFNQKGSRDRYEYFERNGNANIYANNRYRINYLEMPLNIQFKLGRPNRAQFFLGAGPYLGLALNGEAEIRKTVRLGNGNAIVLEDRDYELEFGNDEFRDDFTNSDAGLNLNMGIMSPKGFFIRGNAGIGLKNIDPRRDEDFRYRNMAFSLTVGMLFGR